MVGTGLGGWLSPLVGAAGVDGEAASASAAPEAGLLAPAAPGCVGPPWASKEPGALPKASGLSGLGELLTPLVRWRKLSDLTKGGSATED